MEIIEKLRTIEPLSSIFFDELEQMPGKTTGKLELLLSQCEKCKREALTERPGKLNEDGTVSNSEPMPHRTSWTKPGVSIADRVAKLKTTE